MAKNGQFFLSNISPKICAQAEDVALMRKSIYTTSRAGDVAGNKKKAGYSSQAFPVNNDTKR